MQPRYLRWRRCTGLEWRDEAQLAYDAQLKALNEPGRKAQAAGRPPPTKPQQTTSMMSDLFEGELLSAVTCQGCGTPSYTVDPFFSLSLPIPSRQYYTSDFALPGRHGSTCSACEPSSAAYTTEDEDVKMGGGGGPGGNGGPPRKQPRGSDFRIL